MSSLYRIHEDCLNVWVLNQYRELGKSRDFGSLKLVLKLKNLKFLKCFNYLIFNCRGDLEDPLIQFLLHLANLVNPAEEEQAESTPKEEGPELERQESNNDLAEVSSQFTSDSPRSVTNERTKSEGSYPEREANSVEGYVVFLGAFLTSFVPILLLTYLNRVKGFRRSKLPVLSHFGAFVDRLRSHGNDNANLYNSSDYNADNACGSSDVYHRRSVRRGAVFPSFRTRDELGLLRCKNFKSLLNERLNGVLLNELRALNTIFTSLNGYHGTSSNNHNCSYVPTDNCSVNSNTGNISTDVNSYMGSAEDGDCGLEVEMDDVSGLEALLKKVANLRGRENFHELPDNVFEVYSAVEDAKVREQLALSLSYCARLRSNDLNQRTHASKLFKSLSKVFSKERKKFRFSRLGSFSNASFVRSDSGLLALVAQCLISFNNNLVYLFKVLSNFGDFNYGNSNFGDYNYGDFNFGYSDLNDKNGSDWGNTRKFGMRRLNGVDREVYFAYRTLQMIEHFQNHKFILKLLKVHSSDSANGASCSKGGFEGGNNNLEFVYDVFLSLVEFMFDLRPKPTDIDRLLHPNFNRLSNNYDCSPNNNKKLIATYKEGGDCSKNGKVKDRYEVLRTPRGGSRVFVNERLSLLVFKINFNLHKLLLDNFTRNTADDASRGYKGYLFQKNEKVVKKVKLRVNYELFPLSQWLVNSHLSLLNFKFNSVCQSKPP